MKQVSFLPQIAVLNACVLLILAAVDNAARSGFAWAEAAFWLCLIGLYAPIFLRQLYVNVSRQERIGLVVIAGLSLYLVKIMHSPDGFTFHDEMIHWRTVKDIMASGHLFTPNSIIEVSPLYPGLHIATSAVSEITGLGVFASGVLVLALGRVVLVIGLFLLFEVGSSSERAAGIGTMLYMGNANFIFFMSQFAYESLALPMAGLALYTLVRRHYVPQQRRAASNLMVVLLIMVVTVTHHLTAIMLCLFLCLSVVIKVTWRVVAPRIAAAGDRLAQSALYRRFLEFFLPRPHDSAVYTIMRPGPSFGWTGALVLMALVTWMMYIANPTLRYLQPIFEDAFNEVVGLIQGDYGGRQLFQSPSGIVQPLWERLTSLGSVLLVVVAIPFGILEVWRKHRDWIVALMLAATGLLYPVSLGLRFTEKGWEIGNRASEFLFVGAAYLCGIGILSILRERQTTRRWRAGFTVYGVIVLIGGLLSGWPSWARIPGDYLVAADTRSIEPHSIEAAHWTETHLDPTARVIVDRMNGLVLSAYSTQHVIRGGFDKAYTGGILLNAALSDYDYLVLNDAQADYILVDYRLSQSLPQLGVYLEIGEPNTFDREGPVTAEALSKFDTIAGASRVFDSGTIVVYDIRVLTHANTRK